MQLCALRVGTTINFTDLATNCGISTTTAKNWLPLLHASFVLFLLPSYHDNLGKRVTKSPKLYFYDTGLAASLMGIDQETIITHRTIYGALFENMIIVDLIKHFYAKDISNTLTFFRDSNKNEIDLIIELSGKTIPVEIKASETMSSKFFDTINWFQQQTTNSQEAVVIYGGDQSGQRSQGRTLSWKDLETI